MTCHVIYENICFVMNHLFIISLNIKKVEYFVELMRLHQALMFQLFSPRFYLIVYLHTTKANSNINDTAQDLYGIQILRTKCCPPPTVSAQICILSFARISLA